MVNILVLIALKGSQKFPYVQNLDPNYIYSMYYKNSNVPFCFWAHWAVRVVVEIISAVLLRYPTSGADFLYYFHGQNK